MAMSVDGFVADRGCNLLYPDLEAQVKTETVQTAIRETGAVVMGGRAYEMGTDHGYEDYEFQVPIFVLTHDPPERGRGPPFTFVTDSAASAVEQAKAAAGERRVTIIGWRRDPRPATPARPPHGLPASARR